MAREAIPEIFCTKTRIDDLHIYLASSRRWALRVKISLEGKADCVSFFRAWFPSSRISEDLSKNRALLAAVEAAMENRPSPSQPSFDLSGTPFQRRVWEASAQIPFGQTRTYGEVAEMIGRPGAARAVGQALGRNPLSLIFP